VEVREGKGWRLVVDPDRWPFAALIGGAGWASELTTAELLTLQQATRRLVDQHRALVEGLMAEEALELELELPLEGLTTADGRQGGSLWLALSGDRRRWALRLVLTPAPGVRGIEAAWDDPASAAFAAALAGLDGLDSLAASGGEAPETR
jgi:hypothetical protein